MKTKTFCISEHFLCALINNDESGLEDNDIKFLNNFLEKNKLGHAICPSDCETDFRKCVITNLYSSCLDIEFYLK